MNKIEKMIKQMCPNGVEYKKLEHCCVILDNKRKPVTKSVRISGAYPYYGANGIQDYVSDFIFDGVFVLIGEDGSVVDKNGHPIVNWAEGKIWVNNHAHIIKENNTCNLRYLYHYLQTIDISKYIHGNIPKLTGTDFKTLEIPVPPIEIQHEIVRILDNFSSLTAELTAELTARNKQYEYYRDKLLNVGADTIRLKNSGEISQTRIIKIKDFATVLRGKRLTKNDLINDGKYAVYHGGIEPLGYYNQFNRVEDMVMIINVGASAGTVGYCKEKFWSSDGCFCIEKNKQVISKYLYYYLKSHEEYFQSKIRKAGIPTLDNFVVEDFKVAIPPLDIQNKIVHILDHFEAICKDLNIGLPAEIESRKKQYEYYRDKLLTFV